MCPHRPPVGGKQGWRTFFAFRRTMPGTQHAGQKYVASSVLICVVVPFPSEFYEQKAGFRCLEKSGDIKTKPSVEDCAKIFNSEDFHSHLHII